MYSFLLHKTEARVLPESDYQYFTFEGKSPVFIDYRGTPVSISKGTQFGVRKSTNGKQIRLVLPPSVSKVYTITLEQAKSLAKGIKK